MLISVFISGEIPKAAEYAGYNNAAFILIIVETCIIIALLLSMGAILLLRRKIEERTSELLNDKTRLQTIMDGMIEGIVTIDAKGIIRSMNNGAELMFGYSSEEIIGNNVKILMPEPDKSAHDIYITNYTRTNEPRIIGKNRELTGVKKDGSTFPMALSVKNMTINNEVMFIGLTRDITEQKHKEYELEAAKHMAELANKLKSEFLSNMSHEIRTPMHSIISFARQGIKHLGKWDIFEQEENLKLIKESGERLMLLLNDLLDLSKLESGAVVYDMKENDIESIVTSVVRQNQSLIKEKDLQVDIITEKTLRLVQCDAAKITQVMVNFLFNAIKFTANNRCIKISLHKENNDFILISVEDQGVGIPEDELEKVFDKFIQSSKTKSGAGGTGLGLAICKEIIQGHEGKIWAENNINGGAKFCILLPFIQKINILRDLMQKAEMDLQTYCAEIKSDTKISGE